MNDGGVFGLAGAGRDDASHAGFFGGVGSGHWIEAVADCQVVVRAAFTLTDDDVAKHEGWIDAMDGELQPLVRFILPGGTPASGHLHVARTVCRRAERRVLTLARDVKVAPTVMRYLNRLSDCLFTMARVANARAGVAEPEWLGREERGTP